MDLEKRLEQYLQSEDFEMDLGDLIHDYRAQGLPVPPMEQLREEATAEAWRCLETIMICEKRDIFGRKQRTRKTEPALCPAAAAGRWNTCNGKRI